MPSRHQLLRVEVVHLVVVANSNQDILCIDTHVIILVYYMYREMGQAVDVSMDAKHEEKEQLPKATLV